ncbi:Lipid-droplet associated hydrolase [Microdochium nivale]|nr:Lipid-droplet associated hydrolase [Microdochium nivale]
MPAQPQYISLGPAANHHRLESEAPGHTRHVLIYMISGNPGLIGFYRPFLSTVRQLLDDSTAASTTTATTTRFHIYGQDLAGFSDADHDVPFSAPTNPPRDLEFQIRNSQQTLQDLCIDRRDGTLQRKAVPGPTSTAKTPGTSSSPTSVSDEDHNASTNDTIPLTDIVIIGHSVGSYIALELFHRNLAARRDASSLPPIPALPRSAILLFPTITHIAQSPSGQKLNLLRQLPLVGPNLYRLARFALALVPQPAVSWIVRRLLGHPPHMAAVLVPWLKSRDGVWQALHMGMDEMRVIGEDRWDRELWEIEHAVGAAAAEDNEGEGEDKDGSEVARKPRGPAKFFFLFGQNDHWVADHCRDEFIAQRNGGGSSSNHSATTHIVIDEGKLPHAFCIHHSETVAEKVHTWLRELYPEA